MIQKYNRTIKAVLHKRFMLPHRAASVNGFAGIAGNEAARRPQLTPRRRRFEYSACHYTYIYTYIF